MQIQFFVPLFILIRISAQNLVWGGDFQYLTTPYITYYDSVRQRINSNTSNWFDLNLAKVQVKSVNGFTTTNGTDLSTDFPIKLCQNIPLQPSKRYRIKYSVFAMFMIKQMTLTATLDGTNISSLYVAAPNTFQNQTQYFNTSETIKKDSLSMLCFSQVHSNVPPYNTPIYVSFGGLIDNISIIQTCSISFIVSLEENSSTIILTSDLLFSQMIARQFYAQYVLQVSGVQLTYQFSTNPQGFLKIEAVSNFSFAANQLQFVYKNINQASQNVQFSLKIAYTDKKFLALNDQHKNLILHTSQFLKTLSRVTWQFTSYVRLAFCSYYIFTLISFQNLSLFYIFLNIKIVPQFVKQVYYELLSIAYSSTGFTYVIQHIFHLEKNPFEIIETEIHAIPELIQNQKDGQVWFGQFGFSSLVLYNNLDSFILFACLLLKIAVVKLLLHLINKPILKKLKIYKTHFKIVLVVELISISPTLIVSAIARIVNACNSFGQFGQKIVQLLILFVSLASIAIFFILTISQFKYIFPQLNVDSRQNRLSKLSRFNKQYAIPPVVKVKVRFFTQFNIENTVTKNIHKTTNIKKKLKKKQKFKNVISDTFLFITIPFLSALYLPKTFLIVNSIVITIKICCFLNSVSSKTRKEKIVQFMLNLVWLIHHIVFVMFYAISQSLQSQVSEGQLAILGIIAILTVLAGCCLQIIKFLIFSLEILVISIKNIFALRKYLKKNQKVFSKKSQNQQQQKPQDQVHISIEQNSRVMQKFTTTKKNESFEYKKFASSKRLKKSNPIKNTSHFLNAVKKYHSSNEKC